MCTAAKLYGIRFWVIINWITERKDAHFITIFFTK